MSVLRNRWVVLGVGVGAGALVGLAVYQGSRLAGQSLYVLTGATAGLVAAVIVTVYGQSARLTDVKLTVPQLSEFTFTVTRDSRGVAWKLFVEAVTRVSTQPLADGSGSLREALASLYSLFGVTRDILKECVPSRALADGPTVEHLAIALLNNELRPFLSRWHPELLRWESEHPEGDERTWACAAQCRAELADTQRRLVTYLVGFGKLAGFDEQSTTRFIRGLPTGDLQR